MSEPETTVQPQHHQSNQDSMPPRRIHKVFGIPELLHQVLLNLSMFDLLRAERVSKDFNHAIKTSRRLQVALYRTAEERPAASQDMHPLLGLTGTGLPMFEYAPEFASDWDPLMGDGSYELGEISRDSDFDYARPDTLQHLKTGSWRNMLVRQPPYTRMDVKLKWRCGNAAGMFCQRYDANQARGLTFGHVVDRLQNEPRSRQECWKTEKPQKDSNLVLTSSVSLKWEGSLQEMLEAAATKVSGDPDDYTVTHIIFSYDI